VRGLVAVALLLAAWSVAAPAAASIRVAVIENTRAVEVRGSQLRLAPVASCRGCRTRGEGVDRVRAMVRNGGVESNGRLFPEGARISSERPMVVNNREYGGTLEILRSGDGLLLVNELPLEDYLAGVLRAEASDRWPAEMLRAQAIVARTYAAYHRRLNAGKPFHIVASTAHQQFSGRAPSASPAVEAVRATAGQVLLLDGELFPAFYHTESGGFTEDPRTVFTAGNVPALRPVRCAFASESPHFYWQLELRLRDLTDLLRRAGLLIGSVRSVEVTERTETLRALEVAVHGTGDSLRLRGADFRRLVGYDVVKSTLFAVTQEGDSVRFWGRGWGHGAGMCQWCAKAMAEHGHTAAEIVAFFYDGAILALLPP
jgi:stage II sporulation protein D